MRAFVRYDSKGIIVPSSFVMKQSKPKVGKWLEINSIKSVSGSPSKSSQGNLRAFVRYDGQNKVVPGSIVIRGQVPSGNWSEITYDLSRPIANERPFILEYTITSPNTQISIPLGGVTFSGYDFLCEWGDGTDTGQLINADGNQLEPQMIHTYTAPGVYSVTISGKFPYLYLYGGTNNELLTDIKQWGTTKWESFAESFRGCTGLTTLSVTDVPNLSRLRTSLGFSPDKQFYRTFRECSNLTTVDFTKNWNFLGVELFTGTFTDCTSVTDWKAIENWNMSTATKLAELFAVLSGTSTFDTQAASYVKDWNVSNVTDMSFLFYNAVNMTTFIGTNWNVSNVVDMEYMFWNTNNLTDIVGLEDWDIRNVTNFSNFMNSSNAGLNTTLYDSVLNNWSNLNSPQSNINIDFGNSEYSFIGDIGRDTLITNFNWTILDGGQTPPFTPLSYSELKTAADLWLSNESQAFATYGPIADWDVSNITTLYQLFRTPGFNTFNGDVSNWDVSNVVNMESVFGQCQIFNQDLSSWDVSSVNNMDSMFANCQSFNQNINSWNVSNVTNMNSLFNGALAFDQPLNNWNVSNALTMFGMLQNTPINQDISMWNVSNVTRMASMFLGAGSFNQDLSGWSVASVTDCVNFDLNTYSWALPKPNFTNCTP